MSNFIVSARKYRPQRFEDVVGQLHVAGTLKTLEKLTVKAYVAPANPFL